MREKESELRESIKTAKEKRLIKKGKERIVEGRRSARR